MTDLSYQWIGDDLQFSTSELKPGGICSLYTALVENSKTTKRAEEASARILKLIRNGKAEDWSKEFKRIFRIMAVNASSRLRVTINLFDSVSLSLCYMSLNLSNLHCNTKATCESLRLIKIPQIIECFPIEMTKNSNTDVSFVGTLVLNLSS